MSKKTKKTIPMENGKDTNVSLEQFPVPDSPFTIVKETLDGTTSYYGVMGKYRLTEKLERRMDVHNEVTAMTWNNITRLIMILSQDPEVRRISEIAG